MPEIFAALSLLILAAMVAVRIQLLRRRGIRAVHFGNLDKTDFLIPPFVLFYFYMIFANAFDLPSVNRQVFFDSAAIGWLGVVLCAVGIGMMAWSLVSFADSFRVGIDAENPDRLITTGAFSISRNPIYLAFMGVLAGQFLAFPNWIVLVYILAGDWLINRQILREEAFLQEYYGEEYAAYCRKVRRFI